MSAVFGSSYASAYDAIYRDKDYVGEIASIEQGLASRGLSLGARVLDLGCGTGRHCEVLAARGHQVTGVERSSQMLELALSRPALKQPNVRLVQGDVRDVRLNETFDSALMMFAVLGYQQSNADALSTLDTVRAHLSSGGVFVFDVWWGPGVLRDPPGERVRMFDDQGDRVLRAVTGTLDVREQLCTVSYRVLRMRDQRIVDESSEAHVMRYFFPRELELLLSAAGFELCQIGTFPSFISPISDSTWNVSVLARAR